MKKQPAQVNYFFKDAYKEIWATIASTFSKCGEVIEDAWDSFTDAAGELWENVISVITFDEPFSNFFLGIGHAFVFGFQLGKLILSAILTPIICFLLAIVQLSITLVLMLFLYVGFFIALLADKIYCGIKGIGTSCPNCQEKYSLPTYVCTCGKEHTSLIPSKYGVLARKCECGQKLKTTFFNGRHKLPGKWVCPKCGYELGGPLQIDIPIPVVGGPSSGKTCYISMAISQIEKKAKEEYHLDFKYRPNDALGDDYEENKANMSIGRLPVKTSDMRLRYYQFYLTPFGEKVKNLISICDVAGETYESNAEMGKQIGYKYANAFLMIVDPLSVTQYREELAGRIDLKKYGASERPMDEVLSSLITTLENMKCLTSRNMIKTDVAVVFSKCDIPGLDEKIGESAVKHCMQKNNITSKYEAQNRVCEQFLTEYSEGNFLNSLKSKFKSIQFFTCSALGHVANGMEFAPDGVEKPALWLIYKASASINLKEKWGKKI